MKRFIRNCLLLLLALVLAGGGFILWRGHEKAEELTASLSLEQAVERVKSSQNYTPPDQIPEMLKEATVAIEDRRFYEHSGLDIIGLLRAAASQVIPDMVRSGGSTIGQQTIKNLYGLFEPDLEIKVAEVFLAGKLNELYSKDEILALYVNIITYGDGHIGITEAAGGYFGVTPMQLTDSQSVILAGIPNSPANLQLSNHYEAARNREQLILQAMVREEYLTQEEADAIWNQPVFAWQ